MVDAVHQNLELAKEKKAPQVERGLEPGEHFLVTAHRAENTDDPGRLQGILDGLQMVSREYGFPVVFPIHPRTRKMVGADSHRVGDTMIIDPVGYLEFLLLEASARLSLTDSGGVQEEACIHRVPCVTLRDNGAPRDPGDRRQQAGGNQPHSHPRRSPADAGGEAGLGEPLRRRARRQEDPQDNNRETQGRIKRVITSDIFI